MSFFSTIYNAFTSKSGQGDDKVLEVKSNDYARIPITFRRGCLVLHGPKNNKFELLMLKALTPSCSTTEFSLFRAKSQEEAMIKINTMQETILCLVEIGEAKIMNKAELQSICDLLKDQPSYSAGHVCVSLEYHWAFSHPKFKDYVNLQSYANGRTPLHLAIEKQNVYVIESLIGLGASLTEKDFKGNFIYHMAAKTSSKIIQLLSKYDKTSLNYQNKDGKSALHVACENDKPECAKELLSQGADVNMAATIDSAFPIHTAVNAGSSTCVAEIIRLYPKMISMKDIKDGGTPLHWCMSKEMIVCLIDQGCMIDARNFKKSSALHKMVANDRFECVIALLSNGAEPSIRDDRDNTPLHYATSALVLQTLLVFKADLNILNKQGESVRHCIATSTSKERNIMLYYLNCLDAKRCQAKSSTCNSGCEPRGKFDGVPPEIQVFSRTRSSYDELLDGNIFLDKSTMMDVDRETVGAEKGRVLCLDGGGVKGMVLIQMLSSIEDIAGTEIKNLFDWIAGTSTGAILAISIAMGFSMLECMKIYFKLKDQIFVGLRPYGDEVLCAMLKEKFGEHTVMTEITGPKLIIPAVMANRDPADLHLFRNYAGGEQLIQEANSVSINQTDISCPQLPRSQLVWKAARASSAAPTFFESFEDFVDGGIISNNPTLDTLTEIAEYTTINKILKNESECNPATMVLSLGVGKPPLMKTKCLSNMQHMTYLKQINMALSFPDMAKLLIDQACMADHHAVDRARAWCGQCGVDYFRLSPQLSQAVELDEVKDSVIINMLWETAVYAHENESKIRKFVEKLKIAGDTSRDN